MWGSRASSLEARVNQSAESRSSERPCQARSRELGDRQTDPDREMRSVASESRATPLQVALPRLRVE